MTPLITVLQNSVLIGSMGVKYARMHWVSGTF